MRRAAARRQARHRPLHLGQLHDAHLVAGVAAQSYIINETKILNESAKTLKVAVVDIPDRIANLIQERNKLEKEVAELRKRLAVSGNNSATSTKFTEISGINFLGRIFDDVPARELKSLADEFKEQMGSGVVALVSTNEDKVSLVVGITDDLTDNLNAVDLVRLGSAVVGGKGGGGRPDMAQAGGSNVKKCAEAVNKIRDAIAASV